MTFGAGLGHQQRRARPREDPAEVEDDTVGERHIRIVGHAELQNLVGQGPALQ